MEAAGYEVTRQPFEYNFFEELAPPTVTGTSPGFPFTYTDGVNISTMDYSGSGTVTGRGAGRQRQHRAVAGRPA